MKKTATITFHRAHNYGSVLQTYALQQFLTSLNDDIENDVIDIRPSYQTEMYSIIKKDISLKNLVYNFFAIKYYRLLKSKEKKFNDFLDKNIKLTKNISDVSNLSETTKEYDYLISGSDQIWNVRNKDFEDYYYLNWPSKSKKIAYACSFGPLVIDWDKYNKEKYTKYLLDYSFISTREKGSADNVKLLINESVNSLVDPTLLLDRNKWLKISSNANYNNGKYILLYCLEPTKKQLDLATKISKQLNMPILITKYNNKNDLINNFVKKYDCGPEDFLSYINNASLVLTSSFHGTVFSIVFRKPFYVFDGMSDRRISNILNEMNLENRTITNADDLKKISLECLNEEKIESVLAVEKEKSRNFLSTALGIERD